MEFDAGTWWLIGILLTFLIGALGWMVKRSLDKIERKLDSAATNAENHLQIICIRSVVQAVADAVLAVCKERKLTDAKLYTSHWA